MKTTLLSSICALAVLAAACGGGDKNTSTQTPTTTPTAADSGASGTTTTTPPPAASDDSAKAHKLVMLTTACWFGGVWGDAEGDSAEVRRVTSEARCREALRAATGSDDKDRLEKLRALDQNELDEMSAKISAAAKSDKVDGPRADAIDKLFHAIAAEQRELIEARRAASRVKRDMDHEPDKLTADEAESIAPLRATTALDALLKLDVGDLTPEAHAIGLISAMDRVSIAVGLPRHMKMYALDGAVNLVFGVPAQNLPTDATQPLKKGAYLAYIIEVAKAAGHPVPDAAKTPKDKEPLAWGGTLQGFADKLRADQAKISKETPLGEVCDNVAHRLENEYTALQHAFDSKQAGPQQPAKKK